MNENLNNRVSGLESIIHGIHYNLTLLQYILFHLHNKPFNGTNNKGLQWVGRLLVEIVIMNLYKVRKKNEKFSFRKILNLVRESKLKIDYTAIETPLEHFEFAYDKSDLERIRSKHLAHQDIGDTEIGTDISTIEKLFKKADDLLSCFCTQLGRETEDYSPVVIESFKEIFDRIDEYENVKAFLMVAEIKGEATVNIDDLASVARGLNN